MSCCKCQEHGWADPQPPVWTDPADGREYCVFHAPVEHKGISVAEFNKKIFRRIEDFGGSAQNNSRCDLSGVVFPGEIIFEENTEFPSVSFNYAIFTSNIDFINAFFTGETEFDNAHFKGDADFFGSQFNGSASFNWTKFYGYTDFRETEFYNKSKFKRALFNGELKFCPLNNFKKIPAKRKAISYTTFVALHSTILRNSTLKTAENYKD
ncbi:pentapeptide repeat-containing protein [Desulfocurvus vexinensis]|uniref:pentapeptide repeat-containing protein n=1 Tax=Desulfocurvus vexinensis TaxID=399548 RepID=UPI0012EBAF74|nr:pentapeptide repeat-containing protein [Desulfocurvus vexinensis]